MQILITPEDIIKRCMWDKYVTYFLNKEKRNPEQVLLENKEFIITEEQALVIGLLKVVETENLCHVFNLHITQALTYKSTMDTELVIKKKNIEYACDEFLSKFPSYWQMPAIYKENYDKLLVYVADFRKAIDALPVSTMKIQNITYEVISSNSVKKKLTKTY
jgi:hypothetical protein